MQRHPSSAEAALSNLLQLYADSASPHIGEGVALALAESAGLWAREEAMQALNFLLGSGFVAWDGAVRGLMLEAGTLQCYRFLPSSLPSFVCVCVCVCVCVRARCDLRLSFSFFLPCFCVCLLVRGTGLSGASCWKQARWNRLSSVYGGIARSRAVGGLMLEAGTLQS